MEKYVFFLTLEFLLGEVLWLWRSGHGVPVTARTQVGSPSSCTEACSGWRCILANHSKENLPCSGRCVPELCSLSRPSFGQPTHEVKVFFLEAGEKKPRAACVWGKLFSQDKGVSSPVRGVCLKLPQSHFDSGDQSPPVSLASPRTHGREGLCAAGYVGTPNPCRGVWDLSDGFKFAPTQLIPTSQWILGDRFTPWIELLLKIIPSPLVSSECKRSSRG